MSIFATQEQVNILRTRAKVWEKNGFPSADPHIPELVTLMNQFDNIACVWSCEGHRDDKENSNFYLMLAVTEEGFETLSRLYSKVRDRLLIDTTASHVRWEEYFAKNPEARRLDDPVPTSSVIAFNMAFGTRVWGFGELTDGKVDMTAFYNVIVLGGQTGPVSIKEVFFDHFCAAAKELLDSYNERSTKEQ